jgi:restriction system protein
LRRDAAKVFLIGVVLLALPPIVGHPVLAEAMAPLGHVGAVLAACAAVVLRLAPRAPAASRPAPQDGEPTVALMRSTLPDAQDTSDPDPRESDPAGTALQPKATEWSDALLARIDPQGFGALVEAVYRQAGFETRAARLGADDLVWLHAPRAQQGPVGVARSSPHPGRVGIDRVRELADLMAAHGVRRGHIIGLAGFTPEAGAFGRGHGIHLLDGSALLALIGRRTPQQQAELLELATARRSDTTVLATEAPRRSAQQPQREAALAA